VGGDVLDLTLGDRHKLAAAADLLATSFGVPRDELVVDTDLGRIQTPVATGAVALADAVRVLDGAGLELADLTLRRPSLDDVFLKLTGHATEDTGAR
jgi:ABC-2 type transport system ATP-binding protein